MGVRMEVVMSAKGGRITSRGDWIPEEKSPSITKTETFSDGEGVTDVLWTAAKALRLITEKTAEGWRLASLKFSSSVEKVAEEKTEKADDDNGFFAGLGCFLGNIKAVDSKCHTAIRYGEITCDEDTPKMMRATP